MVQSTKINKFQPRRCHNTKSPVFLLSVCGLLVGVAGICMHIVPMLLDSFSESYVFNNFLCNFWFHFLSFFTNQTNVLVTIYYFLFIFMFKTPIFDNRKLTISICIYINLVGVTYWLIMFPTWLTGEQLNKISYKIVATLIFHLISPIIFNFFCFVEPNYPYGKEVKTSRNVIFGIKKYSFCLLVYLAIYSFYVIAINFIELPENIFRPEIDPGNDHRFWSVYGKITNFNKNAYNLIEIDGKPEYDLSSEGSIFMLVMLFVMTFLFFFIENLVILFNNSLTLPHLMKVDLKRNKKEYKNKIQKIYDKYSKVDRIK